MYNTYILFSESLGKYYTGHTEDIVRRLSEHNMGKTPYLKSGIPWTVVFTQTFSLRSEAMALELKIKKRGAKRFLADQPNP